MNLPTSLPASTAAIVFGLMSFVAFTSCRLTNSGVIGKWRVETTDTLYINTDNTFRLTKSKTPGYGQPSVDTTRIYVSGKWTLYKKFLRFTFNDSTQNLGGGCKSYQYMWTKGSKKTLVRGDSCYYPSNHFRLIHKID